MEIFSEDILYELSKTCQYLYFFELDGKTKTKNITILDSENLWDEDREIVFNNDYRVAGREDILEKEMGDIIEIELITNNSIEFTNYKTTKLQEFTQEYEKASLIRKISIKNMSNNDKKLRDIIDFFTERNVVKYQSPKRKGTSFQEKISNLETGFVLDVSKLDINGVGSLKRKAPTERSKLITLPTLPLVSNNTEHLLIAINLLGGKNEYPKDWSYLVDQNVE